MSTKKGAKKERKKANVEVPVTRDYTINLHKRIHGVYRFSSSLTEISE
jgi:hypothetical protein